MLRTSRRNAIVGFLAALALGQPVAAANKFSVLAKLKKAAQHRPGHGLGTQDAGFKRYVYSDLYRDRFQQCEWRGTATNNPLYTVSADGLGGTYAPDGTVNQIRPGDSAVLLYLKQFWAEPGDYEVTYPAGMSCTLNNPGSKTLSSEHPTGTLGIVARTLHVDNTDNTTMSWLAFGKGTKAEPLGLNPTIIRVGDTDTDWIASRPSVASHKLLGTNCYRTMDMRGINSDLTLYDYPRIQRTIGPSISFFVDLCNRIGADLWLNMSFYMSDDAAFAELQYALQHLAPGLKVYIEWSNEVWNFQFGQAEESCIQGILAGYATSATVSGATAITAPGNTIYTRASGNVATVSSVNGTPAHDYAAGDVFIGNVAGIGVVMATAKVSITANNTAQAVPSSTDSNWTISVSSSIANRASARYYSAQLARLVTLGRDAAFSVGADPLRIQGVVAWQTVSSIITGSSGSVRDIFEFDGNSTKTYRGGLVFNVHATAPYYGGGQGGYKLGPFTTGTGTDHGPWTQAMRAGYTDDANFPAILDAYFDDAVAPAAAAAAAAIFATRASELGDYDESKGLPRNARQMSCYEFAPHNDIGTYTSATKTGYWNNVTQASKLAVAIQYDQRTADIITNIYLPAIKAAATGPMCWYGRFGNLPWSTMRDELDRNAANDNPVLTALINFAMAA